MNFINLNLFLDLIIYSLIPLGLWFSLRIMKYPDLAIEQVFVLGGVIFALCIESQANISVLLTTIVFSSIILGFTTSLIRYKLSINPIIISLIMSYIYYSISLVLLGKPNLSLSEYYNRLDSTFLLLLLLSFFCLITITTHFLLKSNIGNKVIATGCNSALSKGLGFKTFVYGGIGLSFSYLIILSAGAFYSVKLRNADISYGGGFLLMGLFVVLLSRIFDKRITLIRNAGIILLISSIYAIILQLIIILNLPTELTRGFYAIMLLFLVIISPKSNFKLF